MASLERGEGRSGVGPSPKRNAGGGAVPPKKIADALREEVTKEVERLIGLAFSDREWQGGFDLEALEFMTREVMHGIGAWILEGVLSLEEGESAAPACSCGGHFVTNKREGKKLRTVLGEVRLMRRIQRCSSCGSWRVPVDPALDVAKTGFSPGLRRMMAKTGAD